MTIGERAEDVFYITDEAGNPLTAETQEDLRRDLMKRLGNPATPTATDTRRLGNAR